MSLDLVSRCGPSPTGTTENSPPIYRWDQNAQELISPVRDGRMGCCSLLQIFFRPSGAFTAMASEPSDKGRVAQNTGAWSSSTGATSEPACFFEFHQFIPIDLSSFSSIGFGQHALYRWDQSITNAPSPGRGERMPADGFFRPFRT